MEITIIRRIDSLGRLVIPKDIRATLNLAAGDKVAIRVENGAIILARAEGK